MDMFSKDGTLTKALLIKQKQELSSMQTQYYMLNGNVIQVVTKTSAAVKESGKKCNF